MDFNQEQKEIIDSVFGVYLLSAPVGTGKTTVLTERVIKALENGVKPEEILCLTFTNRAAEEMSDRIRARVGKKEVSDLITTKTFHGWCAYFLKAEAKEIGLSRDFAIFEEEEQREVMRQILSKHPEFPINEEKEGREISELIERIYDWELLNLKKQIGVKIEEKDLDKTVSAIAVEYRQTLSDQHALDFNELVLLTLRALYLNENIRKKWQDKYRFVQLDEFQDTHLSEYLVVKELIKNHKNAAFIGDLDQTIYSWRGSQPFFLKKLIQSHFPEFKEMSLTTNYRFNPNVLSAVKSFLGSFIKPETKELKTLKSDDVVEPAVSVFGAHNFNEEMSYVIDRIEKVKKDNPDERSVVIARANYLINRAAEVFEQKGVAHITVDKYEFFRRQEVKDVYAYLKIIFNRFDLEASYRLVKRPPRNIGATTMKNIIDQGSCGLKVSDFLNFRNYKYPEPFFDLANRFAKGRVVVLDTETTGTDPFRDDIIQVFAAEVINGQVGRRFHHYMKNDVPVGFSESVHGISDEFLKEQGEEPAKILQELKEFLADSPPIGHNVNFDLAMIRENGKRRGVDFEFKEYYDTLDLSRRLVDSPNYRLGTLSEMFGLASATHDARDDVDATIGLLGVLVRMLSKGAPQRMTLWQEHSGKFLKLATLIDSWQKIVEHLRPAAVLEKIWEESGLREYYDNDDEADRRRKSVKELKDVFEEKDDSAKRAEASLRELIHYAALVKDINFIGLEKGKVPIVTAHQVKGLEFDHVFVIGANERTFPNYRSDLEEERRLFYVALTRAKKKIYLTYSKFSDYGSPQAASRFIDCIDERYKEVVF